MARRNGRDEEFASELINGNAPRATNSLSGLTGITARHSAPLTLVSVSLWKEGKFFSLFLPVMGCVVFVKLWHLPLFSFQLEEKRL